jgi:hypothetical protein
MMSANPKGKLDSRRLPQWAKEERAAKLQLVQAAVALDELFDVIQNYTPPRHSKPRRERAQSGDRPAKNV